jgi:hypothetical protein
MRRISVLLLCALAAGCASQDSGGVIRPALGDSSTTAGALRWPGKADYNAIAVAVKVRNQALRLTASNQKAHAAQLGMTTLVPLEHTMATGPCAAFVAHIYDELMDLNQAYPGEDWRPMVRVVAHDPSVVSQCASPGVRAHLGPSGLAR